MGGFGGAQAEGGVAQSPPGWAPADAAKSRSSHWATSGSDLASPCQPSCVCLPGTQLAGCLGKAVFSASLSGRGECRCAGIRLGNDNHCYSARHINHEARGNVPAH